MHLVMHVDNIIPVLRDIWNTYVSSTIVYATEAMAFSPSQIEDLEKGQHRFFLMILGLPTNTKSNYLYSIVNVLPLSYTIFQRRLSFCQTVIKNNNRWPMGCLQTQRYWAHNEGLMDSNGFPLQIEIGSKRHLYLIKEIIK